MNEIDTCTKGFPVEVQERLTAIRNIVLEIALQSTERICMRMPTYDLSTRKHYPGTHSITLIVNGVERRKLDFDFATPIHLSVSMISTFTLVYYFTDFISLYCRL